MEDYIHIHLGIGIGFVAFMFGFITGLTVDWIVATVKLIINRIRR